jgi:hypothetical protein
MKSAAFLTNTPGSRKGRLLERDDEPDERSGHDQRVAIILPLPAGVRNCVVVGRRERRSDRLFEVGPGELEPDSYAMPWISLRCTDTARALPPDMGPTSAGLVSRL